MNMGTELQKIVGVLSKKYEINEWWERYTSFETLVGIILSQRTYWKNVRTAIERFNCIEDVAKANVEEIEEVIKPAGLYKVRARRIKNIAVDLVEKYNGDLNKILNLPYTKAKKKLTTIKGIGPKTADVRTKNKNSSDTDRVWKANLQRAKSKMRRMPDQRILQG